VTIVVSDYDPDWPRRFEEISARVWPVVADIALSMEHVGSTSVPGLAAKPVIDIDIVVPSPAVVPVAIERLATLGYEHVGDLTVTGREAFRAPAGAVPQHLYVCPAGVLPLRNHLALREHLRTHPDAVQAYGALKQRLAAQTDDIDVYIDGKTDLITGFLAAEGIEPDDLDLIAGVNRKPV
jgi:GrpB-like predicted nucleotidyltransferase (UPF0157 family)